MRLTILGSSSSGNCYCLTTNDGEQLIIEAGINYKKVLQNTNFNKNVSGLLVTHEHGDHAKFIRDFAKGGIEIFCTKGTAEATGIVNYFNLKTISHNCFFNAGTFTILPFNIVHDAKEPVGFIINHMESGKILFLTDTRFCKSKFPAVQNILIEANYCEKIIEQNLKSGALHPAVKERIERSHMPISTTLLTLERMDLSNVNNIILIHLSNKNSDAVQFKNLVEKKTGKRTNVAVPGLVVENFNIHPF